MTPTTAMEAWQAAYAAWDDCPVTPSLDTEAQDQAAASVLEAWKEDQVRELRDAALVAVQELEAAAPFLGREAEGDMRRAAAHLRSLCRARTLAEGGAK